MLVFCRKCHRQMRLPFKGGQILGQINVACSYCGTKNVFGHKPTKEEQEKAEKEREKARKAAPPPPAPAPKAEQAPEAPPAEQPKIPEQPVLKLPPDPQVEEERRRVQAEDRKAVELQKEKQELADRQEARLQSQIRAQEQIAETNERIKKAGENKLGNVSTKDLARKGGGPFKVTK